MYPTSRPSCMCAQRRLRSACASAQSDQSIRCPHEDALDSWLSTKCPAHAQANLSLRWVHVQYCRKVCVLAQLFYFYNFNSQICYLCMESAFILHKQRKTTNIYFKVLTHSPLWVILCLYNRLYLRVQDDYVSKTFKHLSMGQVQQTLNITNRAEELCRSCHEKTLLFTYKANFNLLNLNISRHFNFSPENRTLDKTCIMMQI